MGCNCKGRAGEHYLIHYYTGQQPDETVQSLGEAQARVRELKAQGIQAGFRMRQS